MTKNTFPLTQVAYVDQPIASGMWKFSDHVPLYRLKAMARAWSIGANSERYIDVHIRKCSTNQYGIGFKYILPEPTSGGGWQREYKKFFHKITDQLKREYGNDFVGWDVSSSTCIVK